MSGKADVTCGFLVTILKDRVRPRFGFLVITTDAVRAGFGYRATGRNRFHSGQFSGPVLLYVPLA
jgi:hypothetical protein